jgi:solute carrier family 10 (sodium/bile acid cotransporter), member 7
VSRLRALKRLAPDPYIIAIFVMVGLATVLPVQGGAARAFALTTKAAIALLFFLHGARLSPEAVVGGLTHWRLHLLVLAATFVVFPLLGLMFARLPSAILPGALCAGLTFLCCLPSTVQSSIAFTAVARGNVAAAVCAASVSNLLGVVVTPVLAAAALGARGGQVGGLSAVGAVAAQLLAPFLAGQIARPWLAETLKRHGRLVGLVDRGSILLVVYGAFSASVADGLWSKISAPQLGALVALCGLLLGAVLAATAWATRALGFAREDQIAVVFCGSKKSLASGVPMASILFPPPMVGLIVLPLMIFHQMQLMACAVIAQRWAARPNA